MVNGIGSSSSYANYLQPQAMRSRPDPADMFKKLDADGSGGISESELETLAQKISKDTGQTIDTKKAISTYDADGNGELSSEEMSAFMQATMQQGMGMMGMPGGPGKGGDLFTALDSDGSGGVSQSELDTWATNMSSETGKTLDTSKAISTYDKDGNGELSSTELNSFLDASGIKPPHGTKPSHDTSSTTTANSVLSKYDTNGDGVLSASELQAYLDDISSTDSSSSSSLNSIVAKALSAYASNQATNLQNLFQSITGSTDDYTSISYSV
jgi:Ca2+-binding EF-hand superfamily protein